MLSDEQMQNLEASGPRHQTTKKTRQKAKKKCSTEEEPKMKREEAPRQATWEEEFAQGRAYFLSKDYSR